MFSFTTENICFIILARACIGLDYNVAGCPAFKTGSSGSLPGIFEYRFIPARDDRVMEQVISI